MSQPIAVTKPSSAVIASTAKREVAFSQRNWLVEGTIIQLLSGLQEQSGFCWIFSLRQDSTSMGHYTWHLVTCKELTLT
jgi:hypothetical protein